MVNFLHPHTERCLSAKEVAVILGVSERTVTRLMRRGRVEAFKMNDKLWRTTAAKVSEYQSGEFQRQRALSRSSSAN